MKLWNVTVEDELVVYAETKEEAEEFAADVVRGRDYDSHDLGSSAYAREFTHLPGGWDENAIPWGDRGARELTIGQIQRGETGDDDLESAEFPSGPLPGQITLDGGVFQGASNGTA